jgi:DNA invertase Pin-like site-specific DNA recombinase
VAALQRGHSLVDYQEWIAAQRAAAVARGGKPLRDLPSSDGHQFPRVRRRKSGELVNPVTGEICEGCLTIKQLAQKLGASSQQIRKTLEQMGAVVHALTTKEVPSVSTPGATKPRYERIPMVTEFGMEEGLVIPITFSHQGRRTECVFVTTDGQVAVEEALQREREKSSLGKVEAKQKVIRGLLRAGHSQSSIVRITGWPKQTVSRIAKSIKA